MDENQKRLETVLIEAIEKESKEPSSENFLHEISTMAQVLIELWRINC